MKQWLTDLLAHFEKQGLLPTKLAWRMVFNGIDNSSKGFRESVRDSIRYRRFWIFWRPKSGLMSPKKKGKHIAMIWMTYIHLSWAPSQGIAHFLNIFPLWSIVLVHVHVHVLNSTKEVRKDPFHETRHSFACGSFTFLSNFTRKVKHSFFYSLLIYFHHSSKTALISQFPKSFQGTIIFSYVVITLSFFNVYSCLFLTIHLLIMPNCSGKKKSQIHLRWTWKQHELSRSDDRWKIIPFFGGRRLNASFSYLLILHFA